jgi:hypothetical protein
MVPTGSWVATCIAPFDNDLHGVAEVESAGRGEGAVLPEAVAGVPSGVDAESGDGIEDHHAGDKGGQLGVAGFAQFLSIGIEQEVGHVTACGLGRLVDQFPSLMVGPSGTHAGLLRPLAGIGEGDHRSPRMAWSCVPAL